MKIVWGKKSQLRNLCTLHREYMSYSQNQCCEYGKKDRRIILSSGWGTGQEGGVCVGVVTNIYTRKPSFSKTGSVRIAKQGENTRLRK